MNNEKQSSLKKLNLGCGNNPKEGWVNLDRVYLPGVDVVHDMTNVPLPFPDNHFDVIFAQQVLDHFRALPVIQDLNRILKPGGELIIEVMHFTSKRNYTHLEHCQLYSVETFDAYIPGTKWYALCDYYSPFTFTRYSKRYITFEHSHRVYFYNRWVEKWVNKSAWRQSYYESSFLSRIFPAEHLYITLVK